MYEKLAHNFAYIVNYPSAMPSTARSSSSRRRHSSQPEDESQPPSPPDVQATSGSSSGGGTSASSGGDSTDNGESERRKAELELSMLKDGLPKVKIPRNYDKLLRVAKSTVDSQIFPYTKFFISDKAIDEQGPLILVFRALGWMAQDSQTNTIRRLRWAVALRNFIQERTTTLRSRVINKIAFHCGGKWLPVVVGLL